VLERKRRKLLPTSCHWLRRHCASRLNRPQPILHPQQPLLHLLSCVVSSSKPRTPSRPDWPWRLLILLIGEMVSFQQKSQSCSRKTTISGTSQAIMKSHQYSLIVASSNAEALPSRTDLDSHANMPVVGSEANILADLGLLKEAVRQDMKESDSPMFFWES
jgi:hypothetical protein